MAHRKQFYPPYTLAFMVVLVRVAFYATSIASLFFKLYSFLKIMLLILKICFSKKKHKQVQIIFGVLPGLLQILVERIKKKRESHKSSSKFQHQGRLSYPIRSISSILKKPTDKIEKEASRGIVNNIECKDRDCV